MSYLEGDQGVLASSFPKNPDWEDASTDDNRGDDVCLTPLGLLTTCKSEWNEEESDGCDKEDSTNDVELPEEVRSKVLPAELLERSSVACKCTCSSSTSTGND
jgi:hypothetical protein